MLAWEPVPEHQRTVDDHRPTGANDQPAELDAFVRWFADWWLRRGRQLAAPERKRAQTQSDSNEPKL